MINSCDSMKRGLFFHDQLLWYWNGDCFSMMNSSDYEMGTAFPWLIPTKIVTTKLSWRMYIIPNPWLRLNTNIYILYNSTGQDYARVDLCSNNTGSFLSIHFKDTLFSIVQTMSLCTLRWTVRCESDLWKLEDAKIWRLLRVLFHLTKKSRSIHVVIRLFWNDMEPSKDALSGKFRQGQNIPMPICPTLQMHHEYHHTEDSAGEFNI